MSYLKIDISVENTEAKLVTKIQPLLLNEDNVLGYWDGQIVLKPGCREILEEVYGIKILEIFLKSSPDYINAQIVQ